MSANEMTISAKCSCGAEFSAIGYPGYVREEFGEWQEIHKAHPEALHRFTSVPDRVDMSR